MVPFLGRRKYVAWNVLILVQITHSAMVSVGWPVRAFRFECNFGASDRVNEITQGAEP